MMNRRNLLKRIPLLVLVPASQTIASVTGRSKDQEIGDRMAALINATIVDLPNDCHNYYAVRDGGHIILRHYNPFYQARSARTVKLLYDLWHGDAKGWLWVIRSMFRELGILIK
jgi:hypothetical protein